MKRTILLVLFMSTISCASQFSIFSDIGIANIEESEVITLPFNPGIYRERILTVDHQNRTIWTLQQKGVDYLLRKVGLNGNIDSSKRIPFFRSVYQGLPYRTIDFNGKEIAYFDPESKSIQVFNIESGETMSFDEKIAYFEHTIKKIRWISHKDLIILLGIDPGINRFHSKLILIDTESKIVAKKDIFDMSADDLVVSSNGDKIACWGMANNRPASESGLILIMGSKSFSTILEIIRPELILDCAWSPDDKSLVYAAGKGDILWMYSFEQGKNMKILNCDEGARIRHVGFIGSGRVTSSLKVSAKNDIPTFRTIEVPSGEILNDISLTRPIDSIFYCPNDCKVIFSFFN